MEPFTRLLLKPRSLHYLGETGRAGSIFSQLCHIWVLKVVGIPGLENANGIAAASAVVLLLAVLYFNLLASVFIDRSRRRLEGR